jgi:hypothetical protein
LGITPEIKDFSCFVMAPAQDGESTTKTFNKYFNFGIPTDVKNIDAFVREPGSRPQLEVTADLRLPEDTDLFAYNLAGVKSLCEECGIFFHNLDLATEDQEFSSLWSRETTTYERGWIDQDDFRLRRIPAGGVNGGQDVLTAVQLSLITRRWGTITLFAGRSG